MTTKNTTFHQTNKASATMAPTRHGRYDDPTTGRLPLSHTIHEEEETHNDISRGGMGKTGAGGTHLVVLPSFLSSLLRLSQATATESPQDFPTYHNCVVLAQRQMESSLRSRAEAAFRGLQLASSCMYNCTLDSRAPKSVAPGPERPPLPKERTRVFAGAAGLFQKFYENTQLPTIDEREDVILAFAHVCQQRSKKAGIGWCFKNRLDCSWLSNRILILTLLLSLLAVLLYLSFVVSNRNAAQHAGRMMGHSSTHASPFSPKRRTCKRALI